MFLLAFLFGKLNTLVHQARYRLSESLGWAERVQYNRLIFVHVQELGVSLGFDAATDKADVVALELLAWLHRIPSATETDASNKLVLPVIDPVLLAPLQLSLHVMEPGRRQAVEEAVLVREVLFILFCLLQVYPPSVRDVAVVLLEEGVIRVERREGDQEPFLIRHVLRIKDWADQPLTSAFVVQGLHEHQLRRRLRAGAHRQVHVFWCPDLTILDEFHP